MFKQLFIAVLLIGLVLSSNPLGQVKNELCPVCIALATQVKSYLESGKTEEELMDVLLGICAKASASIKPQVCLFLNTFV